MKNCHIFYLVQRYFVKIKQPTDGKVLDHVNGENYEIIPVAEIDKVVNGFNSSNNLSKLPGFSKSVSHSSGYCLKQSNYLIFVECSYWEQIYYRMRQKLLLLKALEYVNSFRLLSRNSLNEKIINEDTDFEGYISAFTRYCFLEEYSFWLYDRETEVFINQFGSGHYVKSHISKSKASSLNEVLADNFTYTCRAALDSDIASYKSNGMSSIVRLKLDLGSNEIGILSFYSSRKDFYIQLPVLNLIKEISEMKALHELQSLNNAVEELKSELLEIDFEDIQSYADNLTRLICEHLEYQAASLFLLDAVSKDKLYCLSSFNDDFKGSPVQPIIYNLSDQSITVEVFNDEEDRSYIAYDIGIDQNSHIFDEKTALGGVNWTAVPIIIGGEKIGILRLKDKYKTIGGEQVERAPRPIDHHNIRTIATLIENHLKASLKLKEINKKIDIQNNFTKVFHHEFSAPIDTMGLEIDNLETIFVPEICDVEKQNLFLRKIKDLESQVNRLSFIESTFTIDDLIDDASKDVKSLLLSRDVILPVTNLHESYYKKNYNADIYVDKHSLRMKTVRGNAQLLHMVVNTMIDNASKYLELQQKPIKVYEGKNSSQDYISVYFESYSAKINSDESELIFEKDGRGENAIKAFKHGSGIGLWLTNKILKKLGGNVVLVNNYNPVIFEVLIPKGRFNENFDN